MRCPQEHHTAVDQGWPSNGHEGRAWAMADRASRAAPRLRTGTAQRCRQQRRAPRRNGCAGGGARPGRAARGAPRYAEARARRFAHSARQVAAAGRAPRDHRCAGAAAVVATPRRLAVPDAQWRGGLRQILRSCRSCCGSRNQISGIDSALMREPRSQSLAKQIAVSERVPSGTVGELNPAEIGSKSQTDT